MLSFIQLNMSLIYERHVHEKVKDSVSVGLGV